MRNEKSQRTQLFGSANYQIPQLFVSIPKLNLRVVYYLERTSEIGFPVHAPGSLICKNIDTVGAISIIL